MKASGHTDLPYFFAPKDVTFQPFAGLRYMRYLKILIVLAWAGICGPALLRAQSNPPFRNPSLDSNCYFPQIGVPGEIDTIVGYYGEGGIGYYIHNLGSKPDGTPGNMLISTAAIEPPMQPFEISTGATFNLHDLHEVAQTNLQIEPSNIRFGHFHDQSHLDIFDEENWIIYWADDNGNYDTARKTKLMSNIHGSYGIGVSNGVFTKAYIAHLISDTLDDIVVGFNTFDSVQAKDSLFLDLFQATSLQSESVIIYEDTSQKIPFITGYYNTHSTMQGDFSGTGRDDLLIADYYENLFFYKNDPPFSLDSLVHTMLYDTLWARPSQWDTNIISNGQEWLYGRTLAMHALPKSRGDNSLDWVVMIPTFDSGNAIFIFKGGPDFGSHRITIDSAAYVITAPQLGFQSWPGSIVDGGDMTGTGNHVLCTGGGGTSYTDETYYLTGQALDNKIDIFYGNTAAGPRDTLTANNDNLEDLLLSNAYYGDYGTIWLMCGSKSIPVHLNPQFADVVNIPQENGAGITLSPNPAQTWTVATIVWPQSEDGQYCIYDMLGRKVEHGSIQLYGGAEQQRIYFSGMAQGVYIYTIEGAHGSASARFVKLGGASGTSGTSQPSIIQSMKDARDGKADPAGLTPPPDIK